MAELYLYERTGGLIREDWHDAPEVFYLEDRPLFQLQTADERGDAPGSKFLLKRKLADYRRGFRRVANMFDDKWRYREM